MRAEAAGEGRGPMAVFDLADSSPGVFAVLSGKLPFFFPAAKDM